MDRSAFLALSALVVTAPQLLAAPAARKPELVEIVSVEPGIKLDVRYATSDNFLHRPLYAEAKAFLQRPAAEALARVHRGLKAQGLGIVVFDGYRPWSVTKLMADNSPKEWVGKFIADPKTGSRHNRGCAVDLSLFDLESGAEADMPTPFDDFTDRAHAYSADCTPPQAANRRLLQEAMQREGFFIYVPEWWHFDYKDWKEYAVLDVPFP